MNKLTIKKYGTKVKIEGCILPEHEETLQLKYCWVNPLDFNDLVYFYADNIAWAGIVDELIIDLVELGYECEYTQLERQPKSYEANFLYDYRDNQEHLVNLCLEHRTGIIEAPPGSGKTIIASAITASIGQRTCILVQNSKPFTQVYEALKNATDIGNVGRLGDGYRELGDVIVCLVPSLYNELQNKNSEFYSWFKGVKVLIVDECHHVASDTHRYILDRCNSADDIFGMSATPWRDDDKAHFIKPFLGRVLGKVTYAEQIEAGNLCPITVFTQRVPEKNYNYVDNRDTMNPYKYRKGYREVYNDYIIKGSTGRNLMCKNFVESMLNKGRTVVVIVKEVSHANELHKLMPYAHILHGKTKTTEKKEIFDKFYHREIKCVISTLFDEAVDIPSLDAVAIMAGGKSSVKLIQRIRCTRVCDTMLRGGHYVKRRGYLFYPLDRADFLRGHSTSQSKILKDLVAQHPQNRYYELEDF